MTLIWPAMLATLLLLPPLVALYLWALGRRRRLAARYGSLGLLRGGPGAGRPDARRRVPPALFLAALALLCVALARPQATLALPRLEGTVMLVFDVSGSMAADDVAPSRLAAAQEAAAVFVARRAPSLRVGVVAFSSGGFAVQPPTGDRAAILTAIERLSPQQGTSLGEGILVALRAIVADAADDGLAPGGPQAEATAWPDRQFPAAAIVLLSDGENNVEPDPLAAAQAAAALGVRVHTVPVGTTAGATLQLDGFSVHSRLDEATLQQIATLSDGVYIGPEGADALPAIYDGLAPQLVVRSEPTEVTALFVGASLLLLLAGGLCSLLWFGRLA
ncbi:MAG TPA: VWA domain-containing protein [Chloroflexaceae bacterium]|nr:VWA domain-containing protein [Chloroflexaceae bacterium]